MYQKTTRMKRITSTALSFAMLIACIQMPVRAEVPDQYLPEVEIGEDILQNNVFYIPTVSASINENDSAAHLLKIARGGDCAEEASVVVKIADVTAKIDKDYEVRVRGEKTKVVNPKDNESLLERMDGEEYTQTERKSAEETAEEIEHNPEAEAAASAAYQASINYVLDGKRLSSGE